MFEHGFIVLIHTHLFTTFNIVIVYIFYSIDTTDILGTPTIHPLPAQILKLIYLNIFICIAEVIKF